jgi:hypothetical protein
VTPNPILRDRNICTKADNLISNAKKILIITITRHVPISKTVQLMKVIQTEILSGGWELI